MRCFEEEPDSACNLIPQKSKEISSPSLTSPVQCALFKVACNLLSPCYDNKEHIVLKRAKCGVD